jgi:hypothetical protein
MFIYYDKVWSKNLVFSEQHTGKTDRIQNKNIRSSASTELLNENASKSKKNFHLASCIRN